MKKYILGLLLMVSTLTAYAQNPWSKIGLFYKNNCGKVTFELGSKDTCISKYSLWVYKMPSGTFDTLAHDRVFTRTMDTGLYIFKASFHNKCTNKDTFIYKERVHITCDSLTTGVKNIVKNEDVRVIGYYDMIGRKIDYMELDTPYIVIYSNGKRQKIVRTK